MQLKPRGHEKNYGLMEFFNSFLKFEFKHHFEDVRKTLE